uniref:Endothelial differentiation-related factor 1 n=1 Tax=Suricata suricatta TaxID=37032 RepID=A0A673VQC4_SURSU
AILAAQRRGEDVETSKKWAAGQNKQHSITKNTAKLDRETEELHHDRVTLEVGKAIQQGRQSKGLTQKDLATKINEKPQVIADYESGRAIPNNQVLGKIERAIGECPSVPYWVSAAVPGPGAGRPLSAGRSLRLRNSPDPKKLMKAPSWSPLPTCTVHVLSASHPPAAGQHPLGP